MDNASNCDTTASELPKYIPSFRGALSRSRKASHLRANIKADCPRQSFISFFFKPITRKKTPKVAPSKRKRAHRHVNAQNVALETSTDPAPIPVFNQFEDEDSERQTDTVDQELSADQDEQGVMDEGKAAHDEAAVNSVKGQAIAAARAMGLSLNPSQEKIALELFPKVAGLARRVHDSPTLQEKFEKLVDAQVDHSGQQRSLTRRVPTRWNSDLACLAAHIAFETPVKQLTSDSSNNLKQYALTDAQWTLAKQLGEVLEIFQDITLLFSKAEVPLVHEVIPMLEAMEHDLTKIRNSHELPAVIRIAAIAALLIISKYYALTDDNEVYRIAIVMCPDKKLDWFNENEDWRPEDRVEVDRAVRARWSETYLQRSSSSQNSAASSSTEKPPEKVSTTFQY
ncbi:hypothetical protein BDZ97DRAFT_1905934 [Flammula alnicola]|nr:hypothetical protein BDZ97DRAFT_1905934 [Flammula alnicola]